MKKRKRKRRKQLILYWGMTLTAAAVLVVFVLCMVSFTNRKGKEEILPESFVSDAQREEDGKAGREEGDNDTPLQERDPEMPENEEITKEPVLQPEDFEITEPVVMAFGGDVCFHDEYANMHSLRSRGGKMESSLSTDLLAEMKAADILMVNNEFAYSKRGTPLEGKAFAFRSRPENVDLLHEMGVDIVSLANNHVYDWGEDALFDTLDTLKNAEIPYVGAGRNLDEAAAPFYYEVNGRTIAFISATQVERNENPDTRGATEVTAGTFRCFTQEEFDRLLLVIREADANADMTVVYIHWGTENTDELHWAQEWQAPEMVKAGADLIVGDHPHCLQGIDFIDGVPVFYSIGNFWFNSKSLDTGILKVTLDENGGVLCQFLPALQHDCRTDLASGAEKKRILDYLQCISPDVTIDENGVISDVPYSGPPIDYDAVERVPAPREEPAVQQADPAVPPTESTAQPVKEEGIEETPET